MNFYQLVTHVPQIPLLRMIVYVISQLIGATLAQLLAGHVMIDHWYSSYGPGATIPQKDSNPFQVIF